MDQAAARLAAARAQASAARLAAQTSLTQSTAALRAAYRAAAYANQNRKRFLKGTTKAVIAARLAAEFQDAISAAQRTYQDRLNAADRIDAPAQRAYENITARYTATDAVQRRTARQMNLLDGLPAQDKIGFHHDFDKMAANQRHDAEARADPPVFLVAEATRDAAAPSLRPRHAGGDLIKVCFEISCPNHRVFSYQEVRHEIVSVVGRGLERIRRAIKVGCSAELTRERVSPAGGLERETWHVAAKAEPVLNPTDTAQLMQRLDTDFDFISEFEKAHDNYGWTLARVVKIVVTCWKYMPPLGGSYIELPKSVSKGVMNIQNSDNKCFMYSVIAGLALARASNDAEHAALRVHGSRVKRWADKLGELDWTGIRSPQDPFDQGVLEAFEVRNHIRLVILAPRFASGSLPDAEVGEFPPEAYAPALEPSREGDHIRKTLKNEYTVLHRPILSKDPFVVVLYFCATTTSGERREHYACVTDYSALIPDSTGKRGHHICWNCLSRFRFPEQLDKHESDSGCRANEPTQVILPSEKDAKLTYSSTDCAKELNTPFYLVYDFEALTTPSLPLPGGEARDRTLQSHVPCAAAYRIISSYPDILAPRHVTYSGPDSVDRFMRDMVALSDEVAIAFNRNIPLAGGELERADAAFDASHADPNAFCSICEAPFVGTELRCRDHDHYSGRFRGIAHEQCNIAFHNKRSLPCIAHNGSKYDQLLAIIPNLAKYFPNCSLRAIAKTYQEFMSLQVGSLDFRDSCNHLMRSLDGLASDLKKSNGLDAFSSVRSYVDAAFHGRDAVWKLRAIDLLTTKGVFPYDWFNSFDRFNHTEILPRSEFRSQLSTLDISSDDYARYIEVWNFFECQSMEAYMRLYLDTDVCLLADVLESYRSTSCSAIGLDPINYLSAPALSWAAARKDSFKHRAGVAPALAHVDLFRTGQLDMLLMLEGSIRGGISQMSLRHARANVIGTPSYDSSMSEAHIKYYDANALYTHAMMQKLPTGNYRWVDLTLEQLMAVDPQGPVGYVVECDIAPVALANRDRLNDYAPFPRQRVGVYSEFCRKFTPKNFGMKDFDSDKSEKLILDLEEKTKYSSHLAYLQYCVKNLGTRVTRVHRVLAFDQAAWLSPYMSMLMTRRAAARNDFEKDFWKLLANSCFGKTCEGVRDRKDIRPIIRADLLVRAVSRSTFRNERTFDNTDGDSPIYMVQQHKTFVKLDRPTAVGFCVLELSKLHMLRSHYSLFQPMFTGSSGRLPELCFTDTDSLCYLVHQSSAELNAALARHRDSFDGAKMPADHPTFGKANSGVPGKHKDEALVGKKSDICEFVGLRAKMYAYKCFNDDIDTRSKGAPSKAVPLGSADEIAKLRAESGKCNSLSEKQIKFDMYIAQLHAQAPTIATCCAIRSNGHMRMELQLVSKSGWSQLDNKRLICADGISTRAHGFDQCV